MKTRFDSLVLTALASVLFVACGGGNNGGNPPAALSNEQKDKLVAVLTDLKEDNSRAEKLFEETDEEKKTVETSATLKVDGKACARKKKNDGKLTESGNTESTGKKTLTYSLEGEACPVTVNVQGEGVIQGGKSGFTSSGSLRIGSKGSYLKHVDNAQFDVKMSSSGAKTNGLGSSGALNLSGTIVTKKYGAVVLSSELKWTSTAIIADAKDQYIFTYEMKIDMAGAVNASYIEKIVYDPRVKGDAVRTHTLNGEDLSKDGKYFERLKKAFNDTTLPAGAQPNVVRQ